MVRSGWMPLLAMSLAALSGTARAAMHLSPGQELIYTGTAVWKQSVSGGPPETFQGRVRIAALVTRAAPAGMALAQSDIAPARTVVAA